MKLSEKNHGFLRGEFEDSSGQKCSIEESSCATKTAIWIGVDNTGPNVTGRTGSGIGYNADVNVQMHLSKELVADLLPTLMYFAANGELPGSAFGSGQEDGAAFFGLIEAARDWFDSAIDVWQKNNAPVPMTAEQHVRREVAKSSVAAEYYKAELRLFEAVSVLDGREEFQPDEDVGEDG